MAFAESGAPHSSEAIMADSSIVLNIALKTRGAKSAGGAHLRRCG